jgi:hypothetical protein
MEQGRAGDAERLRDLLGGTPARGLEVIREEGGPKGVLLFLRESVAQFLAELAWPGQFALVLAFGNDAPVVVPGDGLCDPTDVRLGGEFDLELAGPVPDLGLFDRDALCREPSERRLLVEFDLQ